MADLTSQNELAVNGVQWGVSLMAVGTVNINNPGSMLTFRNRRYPEEMLSQGTAKYEEALNAYNILMLYSGVQVHCSVNVVHSAAICVSARGKRILVGSNQTEPFEYVLVHARLYMHACAQTHTASAHGFHEKKSIVTSACVLHPLQFSISSLETQSADSIGSVLGSDGFYSATELYRYKNARYRTRFLLLR